MKKFMITGANFRNKGAQAMLFVTVSELRRRYPDCEIFFATAEDLNVDDYQFKTIKYKYRLKQIALGGLKGFRELLISIVADFVKIVIRYPEKKGGFFTLKNFLPQIDLMIDISGFSLGDQWNRQGQEEYLDNIRLAKKYHVKMVLMPQSFGPFDYKQDQQALHAEIRKLLSYPNVVYAREQEGAVLLKEHYHLKNVRQSPDLVLQNKELDFDKVFAKKPVIKIPDILPHAVAIVPNKKCFQHGEKEALLSLYHKVIEVLLNSSIEVYLLRHSKEDLTICTMIKALFPDNQRVHLLENDFSCLEFDAVIRKFSFAIVSRFHGAVHSYKNCVPCIILGWAVKYRELALYMNQESYAFDIRANNINDAEILKYTAQMIENYQNEKMKIQEGLSQVQQSNCFNILEEVIHG